MKKTKLDPMLITLPKVELHVHLEGFVDADFLQQMNVRNKTAGQPELEKLFHFTNFAEFIATFKVVVDAFQTPEDFYFLTKKALEAQAKDGVVYTETYFTPIFYTKRGLDFNEIMRAIDKAAVEAEAEFGIKMNLIFDAVRNFGPESVMEVFQYAAFDPTNRVIAVGLGGDEANFPASQFMDQFAWAQANGLYAVCHAGETAGEQSMLDAIELLNASRLGHALGIQAEGRLEELIMQKNIALELCPSSNVKTGQIATLADHPFGEYLKRGYQISLNSDDPGFFGTSLVNEFALMGELYNLQPADFCQLSKRALDSSFLRSRDKVVITQKIFNHFDLWKG